MLTKVRLYLAISLWLAAMTVAWAAAAGARDDLIIAAARGDVAAVSALLAKGVDVNSKLGNGATALMAASQAGHLDVVEALLVKGAAVNSKMTGAGQTALMFASFNGHLDVVKALLAKGADVNSKGTDGTTALMLASQNGHLDVVKLLLARGADVDAESSRGTTALMLASQGGHQDIKALLAQTYAGKRQIEVQGWIDSMRLGGVGASGISSLKTYDMLRCLDGHDYLLRFIEAGIAAHPGQSNTYKISGQVRPLPRELLDKVPLLKRSAGVSEVSGMIFVRSISLVKQGAKR